MAYFEFPHTRTYDSDLGWLIKHMGEMIESISNLESGEEALQEWKTEHEQEYLALLQAYQTLIDSPEILEAIAPKILLIGDSYLQGYTPDGNVTSWGTHLRDLLNKTADQVKMKSYGGVGFAASTDEKNFYTLLTEAIDEITDPTQYGLVIIAGGYNDRYSAYSDISAGVLNCRNTIRQGLPNAKFIVADLAFGMAPDNFTPEQRAELSYNYYTAASVHGVPCYCDIFKSLTPYNLNNMMSSDGRHPNATGQFAIARALLNSIRGDAYDGTPYPDIILSNNLRMYATEENYILYVKGTTNVPNLTSGSILCDGNHRAGRFPLSAYNINPYAANVGFTVHGYFQDGSTYADVDCICRILDGYLDVYPFKVNATGNNFYTISSLTQLVLGAFYVTIPKIAI